ncbi:uncharacterized protein MONBRDRAFT_18918 [Monosiga brevicollis MX1]|uniref:RNA helicase n=1 Tax=Monosiga brevicollis TaxID=81824 RepID=A9UYB2_MONBE|nr:uncharacterized protein MONBRDRAFT_18918 [Monosiga brevicollis MX1]EDQ89830.1 predicted protein [Monosiga brevicollis MX1]|eukprot:XP_001745252.1 hypothetical protein [Monosiga brevicollis MX1]
MREAALRKRARQFHESAVTVNRLPEIVESRADLPIMKEEYRILEALDESDVVVICGETGSGKTTQVPQFLYEAGYCTGEHEGQSQQIAVTEPRRIAAMSVSQRVAHELNLSDKEVSYQIRYESTATRMTKIKFMTDGVLQKEIESDFALRRYTAVVIDEAHERSMHTDVLIGLLSRNNVPESRRTPPLKLIIMSATLRVEDFVKNQRLFPTMTLPVIHVDARQYPVTVHFAKHTLVDSDPTAAVVKKVSQVHRRLPAGGILVFMTGQSEILDVCRRLREAFPSRSTPAKVASPKVEAETVEVKDVDTEVEFSGALPGDEDASEGEEEDMDEDESVGRERSHDGAKPGAFSVTEGAAEPLYVLPLYAALPAKMQAKVFAPPPPGHRLCVVATNVAETSLTIPNMRYVVDTGLVKDLLFDEYTGVQRFDVSWTSQASAAQRAGRAGRVGPGHCYRLYSSAVFQHDFQKFSEPEICKLPADGLVLQMKAMGIEKVVNFPFPTPPAQIALQRAEKLLRQLNALQDDGKITTLGKAMAQLPVAPRFAKMLTLARHYKCFDYIAAVVACLTVKVRMVELFLPAAHASTSVFHSRALGGGADAATLLAAVGACDFGACSQFSFCEKMLLRHKAIVEINKLREQLDRQGELLDTQAEQAEDTKTRSLPPLQPPTAAQLETVRQIILAAFPDHVARLDADASRADDPMKPYICTKVPEPVYIERQSSMRDSNPEFIVFMSLRQGTKRTYMQGCAMIDRAWLARLAPQSCDFGKPLPQPEPHYDAERDDVRCFQRGTFGPHRWPLPPTDVSYPSSPERFKLFARALLAGEVLPELKALTPYLRNKPDILLKPWSKERIVALLQPLIDHDVDSRRKLLARLKQDSHFLLKPLALWLPAEQHSTLTATWSAIAMGAAQ